MIMEMDNKKKMAFFFIGGGLLLVVILIMMIFFKGPQPEEPEKLDNAQMELPEGEGTELADSKIEEYRKDNRTSRRAIDDYWDDIGDEPKEGTSDDPLYELNNGSGAKKPSSVSREAAFEEMFGAPEQKPGRSVDDELRERDRRIEERRKKTMDEFIAANYGTQPEPEPEPEPVKTPEEEVVERIHMEENAVRRSDAISSIDDGYGTSGISSLGNDVQKSKDTDSYPFKCMFVRDEKIKNGDRVTVRLLEDMVIGGQLIPKNTHLMANCTLGKRLQLVIPSIQINGKIIALNYDAYDANDGTKGIFCPEIDDSARKAATSYASATATSRARSLVGGIAQDAIQAGTILLSGTGQERKVSVPAGYQFFIVRSKQS